MHRARGLSGEAKFEDGRPAGSELASQGVEGAEDVPVEGDLRGGGHRAGFVARDLEGEDPAGDVARQSCQLDRRRTDRGWAAWAAELLDAVVAFVAHVQVAATVGGHSVGAVELAGTAAGGPVTAAAAKAREEPAVAGEGLDAVVGCVGHIDLAAAVDGNAVRGLELAVSERSCHRRRCGPMCA